MLRTSHFGINASVQIVTTLPSPKCNHRGTLRPMKQPKLLVTLIKGKMHTKKIHKPSPY